MSLTKGLFLIVLLLTLSVAAAPVSAGIRGHSNSVIVIDDDGDRVWREETSFDLEDDVLIITHEDNDARTVVEITKAYELYIDGDQVALDDSQQALVGEFYETCLGIYAEAKEIGWEGAKIGVDGAKLGLKAIGCLFKLLSPNYDSDDMERELEREAKKLEIKAEVLEERAEIIEDMADEVEDLAYEMRRKIPELRDLYWF